jgi:hypothetical protein
VQSPTEEKGKRMDSLCTPIFRGAEPNRREGEKNGFTLYTNIQGCRAQQKRRGKEMIHSVHQYLGVQSPTEEKGKRKDSLCTPIFRDAVPNRREEEKKYPCLSVYSKCNCLPVGGVHQYVLHKTMVLKYGNSLIFGLQSPKPEIYEISKLFSLS